MVLPFTPLTLVFQDVQYYVDTPLVITFKFLQSSGGCWIDSCLHDIILIALITFWLPGNERMGMPPQKTELLSHITGSLRPGVLTALMGVSGSGKTTLLDVLAGRKTCGYIEEKIKIGGYPKVQETFVRISGYCEQADIHSPQITVEESVIFSAWLRLSPEIDSKTKVVRSLFTDIIQKFDIIFIIDIIVHGSCRIMSCRKL